MCATTLRVRTFDVEFDGQIFKHGRADTTSVTSFGQVFSEVREGARDRRVEKGMVVGIWFGVLVAAAFVVGHMLGDIGSRYVWRLARSLLRGGRLLQGEW